MTLPLNLRKRAGLTIHTSVLVLCMALPGTASAALMKWTLSYPPRFRANPGLATNPANGHVLLFGGGFWLPTDTWGHDEDSLGDFWEWDGSNWRQIESVGPGPRSGALMSFNSATGKLMLFGGQVKTLRQSGGMLGVRHLSDTWEWDGRTWNQVSAVAPVGAFAEAITMGFDEARSQMVMVATDPTTFPAAANSYTWSGRDWQKIGTAPTDAQFTSAAFDSEVGRLVLVGSGYFQNNYHTWERVGGNWRLASAPEPGFSEVLGLIGDPTHGRVYLLAASQDQPALGLWLRKSGIWKRIGDAGYLRGLSHVELRVPAVWDGVNNGCLGFDQTDAQSEHHINYSSTLQLQSGVWLPVFPNTPGGRFHPGIANDKDRKRLVVFGDQQWFDTPSFDTWEYDGTLWELKSNTPSPNPGFSGFSLIYDSVRRRTVAIDLNPTPPIAPGIWEWDGTTWSHTDFTNRPTPNQRTTAAFHAALGRIVQFGGVGEHDTHGRAETWLLDGLTWHKLDIPGPPGRVDALSCYDNLRGRMVVFGGRPVTYGGPAFGDTWEFDGAAWANVSNDGPPPNPHPLFDNAIQFMTYQESRGRTLLLTLPFATGLNGLFEDPAHPPAELSQLWEWDGSAWTKRSVSQPFIPTVVAEPDWRTDPPNRFPAQEFSVTPGWVSRCSLGFDPAAESLLSVGGTNRSGSGSMFANVDVPARLIEVPAPSIVAQPASPIAIRGQWISLDARVVADSATYEWRKEGVALSDSGRYSGVSTPTLTIRDVRMDDAGAYDVVVTPADGPALTSLTATLRVRDPADLSGDGFVTTVDLALMLGAFGRSSQYSLCAGLSPLTLYQACLEDINHDGKVDTADLVLLLLRLGSH